MFFLIEFIGINIATFAENAFFKAEAYGATLRAGKILADHGVAVAYKSVRCNFVHLDYVLTFLSGPHWRGQQRKVPAVRIH